MDHSFWDIMLKRKVKGSSSSSGPPSTRSGSTSGRSSTEVDKVNLSALHVSDTSSVDGLSSHTSVKKHVYDYAISDVVVAGAGPSGLMLAANLVRFGIKVDVIDNRATRTSAGRADGLQPKTIETLRQMRLADIVLRKGVKVYDISFWNSTMSTNLQRTGRETHYSADIVDLLDPYCLLIHQGMIEDMLLDDLKERGIRVRRSTAFVDFDYSSGGACHIKVNCKVNSDQRKVFSTQYLVGCDGAHSRVRKSMPGCVMVGNSSDAIWGVLDGELQTDFPDVWSRVIINSEEFGSLLLMPRERNMTRFYVEMKADASKDATPLKELTEKFVMARGRDIMRPYSLSWKSVEWFGRYQVGQRVASHFIDDSKHVLIAGDASHTHSPKAAQGMNISMHDSWNLAWKLNLVIRKLGKPVLLETYETERRKIARDVIEFDYNHSNAVSAGDPKALVKELKENTRLICGVGAEYDYNILNVASIKDTNEGRLHPGCLLPPAAATRYVDVNPVQLQHDIPALGQFRVYFFCRDVHSAMPFLEMVDETLRSQRSFIGRVTNAANASYMLQPPLAAPHDAFVRPERYTPLSSLFTYALVTETPRSAVEIKDLPVLFRDSRWTFYLDDCPHNDTRKKKCMEKWLGGVGPDELVVVNVRPDGYVGCLRRFPSSTRQWGEEATYWLDDYYSGFLRT